MSTPARSPVLGYNHNLKYRGRVYHVQTEDSGPGHPRIFTHLYFGGSIVASKRHEYDAAASPDIVRGLMQSQHKSILRDLKNGQHDGQLGQFFAKRGEALEGASDTPEGEGDERAESGEGSHATSSEPFTPPPQLIPPPPVISAQAGQAEPGDPAVLAALDAPANPSLSLEVLAQFARAFDDVPTPSRRQANHARFAQTPSPETTTPIHPTIPVARVTAVDSSVRIERTIAVGQTPTPTPLTRARRPGNSIPYVVQEGSHPIADPAPELAAPDVPATATLSGLPSPAAKPASGLTPPPLPMRAQRTQLELAMTATDRVTSSGTTPPPLPQTAPLTAAALGATPTEVVSREDNQSLDEVIMAYLARGIDDDQKNVG